MASCEARRPSVLSVASITYQSRRTVAAFAKTVLIEFSGKITQVRGEKAGKSKGRPPPLQTRTEPHQPTYINVLQYRPHELPPGPRSRPRLQPRRPADRLD